MSSELPWFFVVGAQKAGTTTLHDWLSRSSEVALPWSKETHFFRDENLYSKGTKWYMRQFKSLDAETRVVGEVDPEYMYFPECAERIRSMFRTPKLIFILREPLSRARSHYQMSVRWGYESLSFTDALIAEKGRLNSGDRFSQIHHSYLERGLYGKQIERMLACFKESEVLILLFDELFSSQDTADKTVAKVCDFIGISHEKISVDVSVRENSASEPRFIFIRDFIYKKGVIKKIMGKLIPSRNIKILIVKILERMNNKPLNYQKTYNESQTPDFVYKLFIDDLYRLGKIANIDVSHWIEDYERRLAR